MPSTYSPDLRIELIANGEQSGSWGTTTNTNLGTVLEDAISGLTSVSVTSANQALTAYNGIADQARCAAVDLTTTTTANFAVYVPPVTKLYVVKNSSAYTATIYCSTVLGNTTAAGTGVAIPAGKSVLLRSDSVNIVEQLNHVVGNLSIGGDINLSGNETVAGNLSVTGNGAFTGAVSGPTASPGTSTTQLATTAFVGAAVTAATGSLGTMSTQNSNNVNITGGSVAATFTGNLTGNVSGNATTATTATTANNALGVGQTVTNVTSNRSVNTTYTNGTGRTIFVMATIHYNYDGTQFGYTINGTTISSGRVYSTSGVTVGIDMLCNFPVPAGATYSVTGAYVQQWFELR